jgi:hypothetical protein
VVLLRAAVLWFAGHAPALWPTLVVAGWAGLSAILLAPVALVVAQATSRPASRWRQQQPGWRRLQRRITAALGWASPGEPGVMEALPGSHPAAGPVGSGETAAQPDRGLLADPVQADRGVPADPLRPDRGLLVETGPR